MSRTYVKRDMASLRQLKQEGHDIIDDLVKRRWSKNTIYTMLAARLGCLLENAHFYNIHTERDAERAVKVLRNLRADLIRERAEKRRAREQAEQDRKNAAVAAEYDRLAAEQIEHVRRQNVWWRRLLRSIGLVP